MKVGGDKLGLFGILLYFFLNGTNVNAQEITQNQKNLLPTADSLLYEICAKDSTQYYSLPLLFALTPNSDSLLYQINKMKSPITSEPESKNPNPRKLYLDYDSEEGKILVGNVGSREVTKRWRFYFYKTFTSFEKIPPNVDFSYDYTGLRELDSYNIMLGDFKDGMWTPQGISNLKKFLRGYQKDTFILSPVFFDAIGRTPGYNQIF